MSLRAKGERNSEPALAGDISIAMGWSSTQSGGTPRTNKKNILEPVKRVTEALTLLRDNDFPSPGSRPTPWQAVTRSTGFYIFIYLTSGSAANAASPLAIDMSPTFVG